MSLELLSLNKKACSPRLCAWKSHATWIGTSCFTGDFIEIGPITSLVKGQFIPPLSSKFLQIKTYTSVQIKMESQRVRLERFAIQIFNKKLTRTELQNCVYIDRQYKSFPSCLTFSNFLFVLELLHWMWNFVCAIFFVVVTDNLSCFERCVGEMYFTILSHWW